MNNKVKIGKAVKLINSRLPSTYHELKVKVYKTVYSMIKAHAQSIGWKYVGLLAWTEKHWAKAEKNKAYYIDTKYYQTKTETNHRQDVFEVTAYAGTSIRINVQNTNKHTYKNYVFLLLHELGHNFFAIRNRKKRLSELECDLFAIRWFKKFINEKLI